MFLLAPEDFARINPNTGTAPILRTRRDAHIVSRIYRNHPVLVERSDGDERKLWPVRYHRMFDMANDSELFETADQLETAGAYRVARDRYKRGADRWLPLFQGAMVHAYDHRFASVGFNPKTCRIRTTASGRPRRTTCRSVVDSEGLGIGSMNRRSRTTLPEHMVG